MKGAHDFFPVQTAVEAPASQETADKESKEKQPVEEKRPRPLIPKSAILRLLSEVIKSYSNCTQLITQYTYEPSQSELVGEVRDWQLLLASVLHLKSVCLWYLSVLWKTTAASPCCHGILLNKLPDQQLSSLSAQRWLFVRNHFMFMPSYVNLLVTVMIILLTKLCAWPCVAVLLSAGLCAGPAAAPVSECWRQGLPCARPSLPGQHRFLYPLPRGPDHLGVRGQGRSPACTGSAGERRETLTGAGYNGDHQHHYWGLSQPAWLRPQLCK